MTWSALVAAAGGTDGTTFWGAIAGWADVTSGWELALIGFGVIAQVLFFLRWVVQWIASEQRRVSHVPMMFWWLSLSGASLLFIYFLLRGEPVGMLGQSVGWVIYIRNIHLIRAQRATPNDAECCPRCRHPRGPCAECGYDETTG